MDTPDTPPDMNTPDMEPSDLPLAASELADSELAASETPDVVDAAEAAADSLERQARLGSFGGDPTVATPELQLVPEADHTVAVGMTRSALPAAALPPVLPLDPLVAVPGAPPATVVSGPPKAPRSFARLAMATLTMLTLIGALGLLLNRVADNSPVVTPVPVASPASGAITPVSPSPNTVVAPLNQVSFDPAPPEAGADLAAYAGELSESLRPVINVEYSNIVAAPPPWSSHLFGPADIAASLPAPVDAAGKPLCMVAQINLADLPAMPASQGNASTLTSLPREGVLQFWLSLDPTAGGSLNLAPSFVETTSNLRQRVTYISAADTAIPPAKQLPAESSCSNSPPAKGPAVTIGMAFSLGWNAPETTDNRFDSSLPTLAGALRAIPADEFYRATGAINSLLGVTPAAQFGGFNRLVNQDPRTILVTFEGESHTGVATDAYEVLFELHSEIDEDERWDIGFGSDGTGGWWADPREVARLADPAGVTGGRSGIVPSAFWADSQIAPDVSEGEEVG